MDIGQTGCCNGLCKTLGILKLGLHRTFKTFNLGLPRMVRILGVIKLNIFWVLRILGVIWLKNILENPGVIQFRIPRTI